MGRSVAILEKPPLEIDTYLPIFRKKLAERLFETDFARVPKTYFFAIALPDFQKMVKADL